MPNPSYIPSLITGAFALGGVLIGFLFTLLERVRERKMGIRKEVFLQAVETMSNYQIYLAKFPNVQLDELEHRALRDKALVAYNRIHVVGNMETIVKFDAAYMFLVESASALRELRTRRNQLDARVDDLDERARNLEPLARGARSLERRISMERAGVISERRSCHRLLLETANQADLEFRRYLAQALLAARREMGLTLPEKKYMRMIDGGSRRIEKSFRRSLKAALDSMRIEADKRGTRESAAERKPQR